jgi:hypothetical protein
MLEKIGKEIDTTPPSFSQKIKAAMPSEINDIKENVDRLMKTPQYIDDSSRAKDIFKKVNTSGIKSKTAKLARFFANYFK